MLSKSVSLVVLCLAWPSLAGYVRPSRDLERYNQDYVQQDLAYDKQDQEEHKDYYDPPHYTYEYKVDDYKNGDFKRHRETRQNGAVEGYYSLMEADGSLRTVHYTADDKNGFNAVVTKTEPGQHE